MKPNKKLPHLWVVEMLMLNGEWLPTVGVRLSRDDGREELAEWEQNNVCDNFRLRKYARVE